jgi:hypothetical protein
LLQYLRYNECMPEDDAGPIILDPAAADRLTAFANGNADARRAQGQVRHRYAPRARGKLSGVLYTSEVHADRPYED